MPKLEKKLNAEAQLLAVAVVITVMERPAGERRGQQPWPCVRHTRLLAA